MLADFRACRAPFPRGSTNVLLGLAFWLNALIGQPVKIRARSPPASHRFRDYACRAALMGSAKFNRLPSERE